MNNGNRRGVSKMEHTQSNDKKGKVIVRRSIVADEQYVMNDAAWRSRMLSDFLNEVGNTLYELKGDDGADYPLKVHEPIVEPFENHESLYDQVFIKFTASIPGRKEIN